MKPYSLFVVDDEDIIRNGLASALGADYEVSTFCDAETALAALPGDLPDLVLLDIGLPGMGGIEALKHMKALHPDLLIIMITAYEGVETVISAMKAGAHDYIVKPIQLEGLEVTIQNALDTIRLRKDVRMLQERYIEENLPCFIGESDEIQDMMVFLRRVAKSPDTPVLILGETGTGKELLAEALHYRSPNFKGPLVKVNCAAIPKDLIESEIFGYEKGAFSGAGPAGKKGLIEDAANGTLFLDEVGDMSLTAQAKVLRVLQTGELSHVGGERTIKVDVRVIAATNKDLKKSVADGSFRDDLYYRLNVIPIHCSPLSERLEDLPALVGKFVSEFCEENGFKLKEVDPAVLQALRRYGWPGNVREVKNVTERMVIMSGDRIALDDLPEYITGGSGGVDVRRYDGMSLKDVRDEVEREYIRDKLNDYGWNITRTAQVLGIERTNLHKKIKQLGIKRNQDE